MRLSMRIEIWIDRERFRVSEVHWVIGFIGLSFRRRKQLVNKNGICEDIFDDRIGSSGIVGEGEGDIDAKLSEETELE